MHTLFISSIFFILFLFFVHFQLNELRKQVGGWNILISICESAQTALRRLFQLGLRMC